MRTKPPISAPELGLPNPIHHSPPAPPDFQGSTATEKGAYERGAQAGKREAADEKNPYREDSEEAKAYDHGYLDGQKIRSDDKPPA